MGKRSDFERVPRDFYPTPIEAIEPLINHLPLKFNYVEPCMGEADLIEGMVKLGGSSTPEGDPDYYCVYGNDIKYGGDALELTEEDCKGSDFIITNPPWDRKILHPMITHFRNLRPTWLLFDADWMHTKQSSEYMKYCSDIVSVGRVKWIPDSKMTGKDNCAWYKFISEETETRFHGR